MKITISIPDVLCSAADTLAHRLGMTPSELYASAISEHLAKHDPRWITTRLNDVYEHEPGNLDPRLRRLQRHAIPPETW